MLTEKIELVEFPSIAFFAEYLADFKAEAYNDMYATKPPDNPYFYLIASSQDKNARFVFRYIPKYGFGTYEVYKHENANTSCCKGQRVHLWR